MNKKHIDSVLKWTATLLTLMGAACTSLKLDPYNILLLNTGSVFYLIWASRINEKAIIYLHIGLLSIYAIGGLYRVLH
jgi:hypothetical protein